MRSSAHSGRNIIVQGKRMATRLVHEGLKEVLLIRCSALIKSLWPVQEDVIASSFRIFELKPLHSVQFGI